MAKKIGFKVVIALVITIILSFISSSLMPTFGNDVALGQLQNEDYYFVAMQAWHNIQNWLSVITGIIWLVTAIFIIKDIYQKIKEKQV